MTRDERLFGEFGRVRANDAADAPAFDATLARARGKLSRRRRRRAGLSLATIAVLAIVTTRGVERAATPGLADTLLGTSELYAGPTTFLMESRPTPLWRRDAQIGGRSSLRTVDRFQPANPAPDRG